MSGMGDGYVLSAQDGVRIRRLQKQREAERKKIEELKNKTAATQAQPGLLQFGSSTSEVLSFSLPFHLLLFPFFHFLNHFVSADSRDCFQEGNCWFGH